MKDIFKSNYFKIGLTVFFTVAACIIFFFLIYRIHIILSVLKTIIKLLTPFIIGFIIAYLLNPIVQFFNRKIFTKLLAKTKLKKEKANKIANNLSIISIFLIIGFVLYSLFNFIIPELLDSIQTLITNIPAYLETIEKYLLNLLKNNEDLEKIVLDNYEQISEYFTARVNDTFLPAVNDWITYLSAGFFGIVKALYNLIIGFIIAFYYLADKENFKATIKKTLYSIFSIKIANNIVDNSRHINQIFGNYMMGVLLDSMIIGIITFIFSYIVGLPYALLIGVIIGTTNIIPYFGPFIGAAPAILLVLLQSPGQALVLMVFLFLLQQFDGNYMAPKIVGNKIGIKSFWILFAILFFGSLWGVAGMVIGIPLFVFISDYFVRKANELLIKKGLPTEINQYTDLNRINSSNKKIINNEKAS